MTSRTRTIAACDASIAAEQHRAFNPRAMLSHRPRATGYVTQAMIDQHGSFRQALAALNAEAQKDQTNAQ